jgi:hypothetical protein
MGFPISDRTADTRMNATILMKYHRRKTTMANPVAMMIYRASLFTVL